jgi:hypothetical protein
MPPKRKSDEGPEPAEPRRSTRLQTEAVPKKTTEKPTATRAPRKSNPALGKKAAVTKTGTVAVETVEVVEVGGVIPDVTLLDEESNEIRVKDVLGPKGCVCWPPGWLETQLLNFTLLDRAVFFIYPRVSQSGTRRGGGGCLPVLTLLGSGKGQHAWLHEPGSVHFNYQAVLFRFPLLNLAHKTGSQVQR